MNDSDLKNLLARWRDWSKSNNSMLGYNSSTIEHRLMTQGVTSKVTGSNEFEDSDCEALDYAISKMPPKMKKTIKLKYLFGFLNKDSAKTLNVSLANYKSILTQSRAWLCGHLSNYK